ncbi:hypothetical protein AGOR_G00187000 [Albula goreensis]|uniref:DUF4515 domain-containing protein n=1 Tax=Albula goreensis TaxID=1534307 RepID=A0A8T3CYL6_9TELE|nr:hypothetical protein AGOR_G00187000 [Albula goreensis]
MPKKKKENSDKKPEPEVPVVEQEEEEPPPPTETEREAQLRREYDELTHTLNDLKKKAEQLRCENDVLQTEAEKMRVDSREYTAYVTKRTQKRQSAIVTLSEQNQQELEELRHQREQEQEEHSRQANELKKQILERENELVLLKTEIEELGEIKRLQKQQLVRVAELQREMEDTNCRHTDAIQALRAQFFAEKQKYEARARQKVHALALAANKEASQCLMAHTQQVCEENQRLRKELQQLIQRAQVLHDHQEALQTQRQGLLLELEYVQDLRQLRPAHTAAELSQQEAVCSEIEARAPPPRPDAVALARSRLQKQQLVRIAELQREMEDTNCRHTDAIQALRAQFFAEKQKYEARARQKVHALALAANKEASQCLMAHTQQVCEENQRLRKELQQLIQRAQVLHDHQEALQTQRQGLLLELEYVQDLRQLRPAHTAAELSQQEAVCSEIEARPAPHARRRGTRPQLFPHRRALLTRVE